MAHVTDYECLFPLAPGPVRVFVTSDASRSLGSIMDDAGHSHEAYVLLFATSADLSHDDQVDSLVVVDNLVGNARKFFKAEPTAEKLAQFRDGLHAWICEHHNKNTASLDA